MIDKYLEKLNSLIDPNRARQSEELQNRTANYETVNRLPLSISTYDEMSKERKPVFVDWPVYDYGEAYLNPEKMLLNELLPIYEGELFKDDRVSVIRANYGVGIIPSLFGCKIIQKDNELPWVVRIKSIEDIKKILRKGIPDFKSNLLAKVNETQEYFFKKLNNYSNLKDSIHIGLPDVLGPFNLAGTMIGEDLYIYLYSQKKIIKEFLELLTQTYIKFALYEKNLIQEPLKTGYYFGCRLSGGIKISEDYALAISPSMYEEFCIPENEKIAEIFSGFTLVVCEDLEIKRAESIFKTKGLKGIMYWSRDFEKLQEIHEFAKKKKVCIFWFDTIPESKRDHFSTGIILKRQIKSMNEVKKIIIYKH
ncbi:MAG: hypothetical protein FJW61_00065 [Actinobacteria bacterium]|nr:hypothetical protein [Actinomycetota bacterium]